MFSAMKQVSFSHAEEVKVKELLSPDKTNEEGHNLKHTCQEEH